jgi:hypothetical protein
MKLKLIRKIFTEEYTLGELYINDVFFCSILEDKDRGLDQSMKIAEILKTKVKSKTAIPYGTYTIDITYSNRFKTNLPILLNVPGYSGIRIHTGNTHHDTDGCLLPGVYAKDRVINSRETFRYLFAVLFKAKKDNELITIEISKS